MFHLGQVSYCSRLGDPHLRAKIDLDYAFKISRDIQGLAAVSFLMPRFTDPPLGRHGTMKNPVAQLFRFGSWIRGQ
jgi:hypothetical protein